MIPVYRRAQVLVQGKLAGIIAETDTGYVFRYFEPYLKSENPVPVSLTLPLSEEVYTSTTLFPFFDGLIPEGWLLNIAQEHWKIDLRDRMALLLACCQDCIGVVSVVEDTSV